MGNFQVSFPKKRLATALLSTGMSFTLNNIKTWAGIDAVSGDFGSVGYGTLINASGTQIEFFTFDPTTIASAAITILARGLDYHGGTTDGAATKYDWNANETIVLLGTNPPALYANFVDKTQNQTVSGLLTFAQLPLSTDVNPPASTSLITRAYADALVLGTLTTINVIVPGTAGATISAGQLVYFDDATNKWKLTDADTAATVENVLLGIAQGSGTDTNSITGGVLLQGVDTHQTGLTDGVVMYASNTAGGISSSAGTISVVVGISKGTTQLYFAPRFNQQITQGQKDALAGTSGTPSSTNKYVTDADTAGTGAVQRASALAGYAPLTNTFLAGESISVNDAVSMGGYQSDGGILLDTSTSTFATATSVTMAINVGNNSNRAIVVFLGYIANANVSSATCGGAAMTKEAELGIGGAQNVRTYMYTFLNPGTGSQNIQITWGTSCAYRIVAYSFYNVGSIGAKNSSYNDGSAATTYSVTIAGQGELVVTGASSNSSVYPSTNTSSNQIAVQNGTAWLNTGHSGVVYPKQDVSINANSGGAFGMASVSLIPFTTMSNVVVKSSAASVTNAVNNKKYLDFVGFATEAKSANQNIAIQSSHIITGLSGLVTGQIYYMSDTGGAISLTAGTNSKKVGLAVSTTSLLILNS